MKKRGLRTHTWKLIVPLETPDLHGSSDVELYHLPTDPGELHNIAAEQPAVVARLTQMLETHVADRLSATGLPDPLPIQPIPLRHIGGMEVAVPRDKRLTGEQNTAPPVSANLESGDFVGYDRDEDNTSSPPTL